MIGYDKTTADSAAAVAGKRCPACLGIGRTAANFVVDGRISLYHCVDCGLGALELDGTDHEGFDEYWTEINQRIYADPAVMKELTAKYEGYFARVKDAVPNRRFLDVGSGAGMSIGAAARLGFEATGIEPSANAVALSRRQFDVPVIQGLLQRDDELPRDYGMLALWDVIEHVVDPEDLVLACQEHLAPGGILLLETPDEGTLLRGILRGVGALNLPGINPRKSIYYRAHRYYFTRTAMARLLERCGFSRIRFFGEHTMFEKELLKKKLYGRLPAWKGVIFRLAFAVLKRLPLMANKMVVVAVKKPA